MILEPIIYALRERCLSFGGRVAGLAEYEGLTERSALKTPSAYVVPLEDDPGPCKGTLSTYHQVIQDQVAVIAVLNNSDRRGQEAAHDVYRIRTELWTALLGWEPTERHSPCVYTGGQLVTMTPAFVLWKYTFSTEVELTEADTFHGNDLSRLTPLDAVDVRLKSHESHDTVSFLSIPLSR